jgi:hypothetical protein
VTEEVLRAEDGGVVRGYVLIVGLSRPSNVAEEYRRTAGVDL